MRVLVVSNGYGEDGIAARVATALMARGHFVVAYPLLGTGAEYRALSIPIVSESPVPKSGGFLRKWRDVWGDLCTGAIATAWRQRQRIKTESARCDAVVAVGDVFCLMMATAGNRRPTAFVPTAKSDYFMPHSRLEMGIINRRCRAVFPRDARTTETFRRAGMMAYYFGNPMMDALLDTSPLPRSSESICLALLPGSRSEAGENLRAQLGVVEAMDCAAFAWVCRSPVIPDHELAESLVKSGFEAAPNNRFNNGRVTIQITDCFSGAVQSADLVLGHAGTGNEQAVWLGKRVVTFPGAGPQTQPVRLGEQQKLLGSALIYVQSRDSQCIAMTVLKALKGDPLPAPQSQHAAADIALHLEAVLQ